jgi:hypothetical protein
MNRRAVVTGVGAVLAAARAVEAQPVKGYQVGVLSAGGDAKGWRAECKPAFGDGKADRLPAFRASRTFRR